MTRADLTEIARHVQSLFRADGLAYDLDAPRPGQVSTYTPWHGCAHAPAGFAIERLDTIDGEVHPFRVAEVVGRCWRLVWEHEDCETPDAVGPWSEPYTGRGWRDRLAVDVAAAVVARMAEHGPRRLP